MYFFHLLLDNRVEYQYSIESYIHVDQIVTYSSRAEESSFSASLVCSACWVIRHGGSFVFRLENLFSEKYSKLKHTSQIMKKEKQLTRHFSLVCPRILAVLHLQRRSSQQTIILLTESHIDIHCLHTCTIFLLYIR